MIYDKVNNVIRITAYKDSGKWYSTNESILMASHNNLDGFKLFELIKNNDESVREYSGIIGGFPKSFFYEVRVLYLDEANQNNFCHFLLLAER